MRNRCIILLFMILSVLIVEANNVRVNGKVLPTLNGEGLVQLNFSVSWDNAWNDPYNWDALWAFVKYRKKSETGAWHHAYLAADGHTATDLNFVPATTLGKVVGGFLFSQVNGSSDVSERGIGLVLERSLLDNVTANEVKNGEVEFFIQLIEMVLIPEGAYYLGDGASQDGFVSPTDASQPVLIDAANKAIQVKIGMETMSLSTDRPNGYNGFYAMKYELSQGQYADFLNRLSRAQQIQRFPDLNSWKFGTYVFGDPTRPNGRNGIVVMVNEPDRPAIFGHNLHQDEYYNKEDDGQTLACNFISESEMLNYCDWAGLRPMSELEFEKACRKPFPDKPVAGEYAWNSVLLTGIASEAELINSGSETEYITDADRNANYGNKIGPLRCGVFASHPSGVSREEAGATCSGLLEMSGNLREICYQATAEYRYYQGEVYHGDGELNPSGITNIPTTYWPQAQTAFILKGGGYTSSASELRVSDRSGAAMLMYNTTSDSTVGFRAVRTAPAAVNYIDPGEITGLNDLPQDSICSSPDVQTYQIVSRTAPSFQGQMNGVRCNYQWYLKKGDADWELLRGETNPTLTYQDAFLNTTSDPIAYQFRRDAQFPGGTVAAPVLKLWVLNVDIEVSAEEDYVDGCDIAAGITVTTKTDAQFSWTLENKELLSTSGMASTYKARRKDFLNATTASPYQVVCRVTAGKCKVSHEFSIAVESATSNPADCPCGTTFVDDRDGKEYPTVQIGAQCWMAKNLNVGEMVSKNRTKVFWDDDIQKWCYDDQLTTCTRYGGLYEWWEVVCGGKCNEASSAMQDDGAYTLRGRAFVAPGTVSNNTILKGFGVKLNAKEDRIQGICPDGWHVPNDGEWSVLESYIGMNSGESSSIGWGRGGNVKQLMTEYGYGGSDDWCTGDCNSTGFSAYFGGYIENRDFNVPPQSKVVANDRLNVGWWSASLLGNSSASAVVRQISVDKSIAGMYQTLPTMGRNGVDKNSMMYVRCIRD